MQLYVNQIEIPTEFFLILVFGEVNYYRNILESFT